MRRADSLSCRRVILGAGANLMKHQSGQQTVRTDEFGACGVGCLARLLPCRNGSGPGIQYRSGSSIPQLTGSPRRAVSACQVESTPRRRFG